MVDLTRRRVVALSGTAAVGGVALSQLTQPVAASSHVTLGNFSLPDKTYYPDGTVDNVVLGVDVAFQWTVNRTPDKYTLELNVGNTETDLTPIDSVEQTGISASDSQTTTLQGSLVDSPDYDLGVNFDVSDGSEKQTTVWAQVVFEVHRNGTVLTTSEAITQATIIMEGEDLVASSEVGADGSFGVTDS